MRRILPLLVLAALGLGLAPAGASAKEISSVSVCGADGCKTVRGAAALGGLEDGGPADSGPAAPAPFYRVRITVKIDQGRHDSWTVAYVPTAGMIRSRDELGDFVWLQTTPASARAFRRASRGVTPFPKAKLRGVGSADEPTVAKPTEAVAPSRRSAPTATSDGFPALGAAGGIGALLLVAAGGWAARRRRARPRSSATPRSASSPAPGRFQSRSEPR